MAMIEMIGVTMFFVVICSMSSATTSANRGWRQGMLDENAPDSYQIRLLGEASHMSKVIGICVVEVCSRTTAISQGFVRERCNKKT